MQTLPSVVFVILMLCNISISAAEELTLTQTDGRAMFTLTSEQTEILNWKQAQHPEQTKNLVSQIIENWCKDRATEMETWNAKQLHKQFEVLTEQEKETVREILKKEPLQK